VRFDADALDTSIGPAPAQSVVTAVHPTETGTGIALDLGPRFGSFRATDMPGDQSIMHVVVDVFPTLESSAGPASPIAPPPEQTPLPTPGTATHVIVIDPGHGGPDEGVRGAKGILEKDITLAVARRLKTAIESRIGARVLLTRDDDRIVSPDDRAALANNNKGDIFVSLHVAGSPQTTLSGASVFSLAADSAPPPPAGSPAAETVSMPVFGGTSREIALTPWEHAQATHVNDSLDLAQRMEATLRSVVPLSPRPRQQAPLRVLVGANMPAVLVEIGYLTNPQQEPLLANGDFQFKVAQALADAVALFDNAQRSLANGPPGAPR
jgi:N-acetylmuramoyl-L-alanine amidase